MRTAGCRTCRHAGTTGRALVLGLLLGVAAVLLGGCDLSGPVSNRAARILVVNGGAALAANSSYTVYDPAAGTARRFPSRGGFAARITGATVAADSALYLLFGGTGSLAAFAPTRDAPRLQVRGLSNPQAVALDGPTAYVVGQRYDGADAQLYVIDRQQQALVDSVALPGLPADVAVRGDSVYVAAPGRAGASGSVIVVDARRRAVTRRFEDGCDRPRRIVVDAQGELVVTCTGADPGPGGTLQVLDPATGAVQADTTFGRRFRSASAGAPSAYSAEAEVLHALLEGTVRTGAGPQYEVVRYDTATNRVAETVSVPVALTDTTGPAPIGAVGYDAVRERLHLGRLAPENGFSAPGTVTIHDRAGQRVGQFDAGVAPIAIFAPSPAR
jgi:hypothetical protein